MLEAEKIKSNWEDYREIVNTMFPTRKVALNKMYDEFEERMVFMPASGVEHYHNAFAGGYVDHILRVIQCAESLHHDLGKIGFPGEGNEVYQIETSDWHRKNQGKMYKHNQNIPFAMVPDLSIWLLQEYGVKMSWTEYQAIKIHDGMYDDANKPYFVARSAQAKLKTNLPLLLHHADHMASQIEYERWRNYKAGTPVAASVKSTATKSTAMKNLAENNPTLDSSISDIFSSFNTPS